jgi:hypothetical protein
MGFFEQLINEITNMDLANFIIVALLFYLPFYFSRKAETLFFHLFYSGFGLYLLFTMEDIRIIYDVKMLIGLGLLIPQIRFLRWFIPYSIQTIKMMTSNTYYFFITIYYKTTRFIKWLKSIPYLIKTFFTNFSFKNFSESENDYEEYRYNYQKKENFYKEEENQSFNEDKQESYQETKNDYGEYARFYSDNAYIVLGVNSDDDFDPTIKKAYKKLVRIYHPDVNPDNIKQATEITQLLNNAYEKLEKYHNK